MIRTMVLKIVLMVKFRLLSFQFNIIFPTNVIPCPKGIQSVFKIDFLLNGTNISNTNITQSTHLPMWFSQHFATYKAYLLSPILFGPEMNYLCPPNNVQGN